MKRKLIYLSLFLVIVVVCTVGEIMARIYPNYPKSINELGYYLRKEYKHILWFYARVGLVVLPYFIYRHFQKKAIV